MAKGNINVSVENIFPMIKKFLYSDHEIFLRELISNGTDATTKLKHLIAIGEAKTELGNAQIEVSIDKEAKTLTISDQGMGMTADEVEKYINQIAFSGAEEFLDKYKDDKNDTGVIGHFGLGFYSAFMVADNVEIITKSYKDEPAAHWTCDGSPEFTLVEHDRKERGTTIILHIADDSTEFLEEAKIGGLLSKYNRFNQVAIKFGTNEVNDPDFTPKTTKDKDGKETTEPHKQITVDNIINNTTPAWTKKPADLEDEDYNNFYRELYPTQFEESLFHIHLNVDYPFNLTGILYFPKFKQNVEVQKNKIQLYSNQVFITDSVENIVPEFLTLLQGVIDSPDIPLNVSRSYLQSDNNVRKISTYITKKVADKLAKMFKNDRADFEQKWDDIKVFIQYGILSDVKFEEKAAKFNLLKDTEGKYFTTEEYKEAVKDNQTDKNDKLVYLYTHDVEAHHSIIESAKERGYSVLVMDSPLDSHVITKLEQSLNVSFARLDADTIDKLITKDEEIPSKLSKEEEEKLQPIFEVNVNKDKFTVQFESLSETEKPVLVTQSEFIRRMKEQQAMGGGMQMMGDFPEMFNLVVNSNHPLVSKIMNEKDDKKKENLAKQAIDLALLSNGMLKGSQLTDFINRSLNLID